MPQSPVPPQSPPYQLFMLFLCVMTLVGVAIQVRRSIPPPKSTACLQVADTIACGLFFVDFLVTLRRAPDKWRYMYTWGWLDLVSSIPVFDLARWGRAARVARLLRLLRGVKASMVLTEVVLMRRRESASLAAGLALLLVVVSASVLILTVEDSRAVQHQAAPRTRSGGRSRHSPPSDTATAYPVTTEGRVIATCVMGAGVGLVGVLSGLLASWFMEGANRRAARGRSRRTAHPATGDERTAAHARTARACR